VHLTGISLTIFQTKIAIPFRGVKFPPRFPLVQTVSTVRYTREVFASRNELVRRSPTLSLGCDIEGSDGLKCRGDHSRRSDVPRGKRQREPTRDPTINAATKPNFAARDDDDRGRHSNHTVASIRNNAFFWSTPATQATHRRQNGTTAACDHDQPLQKPRGRFGDSFEEVSRMETGCL